MQWKEVSTWRRLIKDPPHNPGKPGVDNSTASILEFLPHLKVPQVKQWTGSILYIVIVDWPEGNFQTDHSRKRKIFWGRSSAWRELLCRAFIYSLMKVTWGNFWAIFWEIVFFLARREVGVENWPWHAPMTLLEGWKKIFALTPIMSMTKQLFVIFGLILVIFGQISFNVKSYSLWTTIIFQFWV